MPCTCSIAATGSKAGVKNPGISRLSVPESGRITTMNQNTSSNDSPLATAVVIGRAARPRNTDRSGAGAQWWSAVQPTQMFFGLAEAGEDHPDVAPWARHRLVMWPSWSGGKAF